MPGRCASSPRSRRVAPSRSGRRRVSRATRRLSRRPALHDPTETIMGMLRQCFRLAAPAHHPRRRPAAVRRDQAPGPRQERRPVDARSSARRSRPTKHRADAIAAEATRRRRLPRETAEPASPSTAPARRQAVAAVAETRPARRRAKAREPRSGACRSAEHLVELRKRLTRAAIAIVVGAIIGWLLYDLTWLGDLLEPVFPAAADALDGRGTWAAISEPVMRIAEAKGADPDQVALNFTNITGRVRHPAADRRSSPASCSPARSGCTRSSRSSCRA